MPQHLAFPISLGSKALATVTQDSNRDVAQSVALLLNTRPGERRSIAEYGLPDPVFDKLTDAEVLDVVNTWEPRAELDLLAIQNFTDGSLGSILVPPGGGFGPGPGAPDGFGHPTFDTDGVPYLALTGPGTVAVDDDGVPYVSTGDGSPVRSDTDSTPYFI